MTHLCDRSAFHIDGQSLREILFYTFQSYPVGNKPVPTTNQSLDSKKRYRADVLIEEWLAKQDDKIQKEVDNKRAIGMPSNP